MGSWSACVNSRVSLSPAARAAKLITHQISSAVAIFAGHSRYKELSGTRSIFSVSDLLGIKKGITFAHHSLKGIIVIPEPTFYAIYDADGSVLGELQYLRDKCLGRADCALCDLSHGWNPMGRSAWRQRKGITDSINWVHRDELPQHIATYVTGHLPCVVMASGDTIEIVVNRSALKGCEGDFSVFEHLLEQTLRTLQTQASSASGDGPRT